MKKLGSICISVDCKKPRVQNAHQQGVQAHAAVWPVIEKAGTTLYALEYVAQSGRLEALFTELDKVKHQTALETMGVTDIYTELKQA